MIYWRFSVNFAARYVNAERPNFFLIVVAKCSLSRNPSVDLTTCKSCVAHPFWLRMFPIGLRPPVHPITPLPFFLTTIFHGNHKSLREVTLMGPWVRVCITWYKLNKGTPYSGLVVVWWCFVSPHIKARPLHFHRSSHLQDVTPGDSYRPYARYPQSVVAHPFVRSGLYHPSYEGCVPCIVDYDSCAAPFVWLGSVISRRRDPAPLSRSDTRPPVRMIRWFIPRMRDGRRRFRSDWESPHVEIPPSYRLLQPTWAVLRWDSRSRLLQPWNVSLTGPSCTYCIVVHCHEL